jgi:hypothetical protein
VLVKIENTDSFRTEWRELVVLRNERPAADSSCDCSSILNKLSCVCYEKDKERRPIEGFRLSNPIELRGQRGEWTV